MKRIYQAPQTNAITLANIPTLCAGSLGSGDTPNGNLNDAQESEGGIPGDSRRSFGYWDDEE